MRLWQRPVRIALAAFAVAFGAILSFGVRDRAPIVVSDTVSRSDREAVIESRNAEIVQRENRTDNLKVEADRQFGYEDGSAKLVGNVKIEFGDGLVVDTEEALYENGGDVVSMPGLTRFVRPNMEARAGSARYERNVDLLYLEPDATVLVSQDGETDASAKTEITANRALVAQSDGYMEFGGGVAISGERQTMGAREIHTNLDPDSSVITSVALNGNATVSGTEQSAGSLELLTAPNIEVSYDDQLLQKILMVDGARLALYTDGSAGQLREMSAADIIVDYLEDQLSSIVLDRTASISLVGTEDGRGTEIDGEHIEVSLGSRANAFERIYGNDEVSIQLPVRVGVLQGVSARTMEVIGSEVQIDGAAGMQASFEGEVEYFERDSTDADGGVVGFRRINSEKLSAELGRDFVGIHAATFTGKVEVETGELTGSAEQVIYDVETDQVTFSGMDDQGQNPLVNDSRGSLLATTINVQLDGPDVQATGAVSSVLSPAVDNADGANDAKRPQLLSEGVPIYVTATEFVYIAATSKATYTGASRLWQDSTEFRADSLILDESTGDVTAAGTVETQILILQNAEDSDEVVEIVSTGSGESFEYIDAIRTATYSTSATLLTEVIDLSASSIQLRLEADGRSLQRILASGAVELVLEGRQMVGETMAYYEDDGRYEMTGDPVRIIEELAADSDDGETESIECRETTGQALTFYVTSEALSVDAQSETRTTSMSQPCPALDGAALPAEVPEPGATPVDPAPAP